MTRLEPLWQISTATNLFIKKDRYSLMDTLFLFYAKLLNVVLLCKKIIHSEFNDFLMNLLS